MAQSDELGGSLNISPEQLQEILKTVLQQANQLNPIEQRKLDEELAREHRRNLLMVELGKQEELKELRKRNGCTHMRDPKTGDNVARGTPYGEWTTGGQAYQNGLASLICTRCSTVWLFKPEAEYYNYILQNGMMKQPPPAEEFCYCMGCLELKTKCICDRLREEQ